VTRDSEMTNPLEIEGILADPSEVVTKKKCSKCSHMIITSIFLGLWALPIGPNSK
jgi:hypothetical protein